MSGRPFYDDEDRDAAQRYVDGLYSAGAFDPVIGGIGEEDKILTAQVASIRDYMRQSEGTRSGQGGSVSHLSRPCEFHVPQCLRRSQRWVARLRAAYRTACHGL